MNTEDYHPPPGIPEEAKRQEVTVTRTRKNFAEMLAPQIQSVNVIYYNPDSFSQQSDAENYVNGFLSQRYDHSKVNGIALWAGMLGYPEVECEVNFNLNLPDSTFDSRRGKGRLIFWRIRSCYRDFNDRWWFFSIADHFRKHHPKNNPPESTR